MYSKDLGSCFKTMIWPDNRAQVSRGDRSDMVISQNHIFLSLPFVLTKYSELLMVGIYKWKHHSLFIKCGPFQDFVKNYGTVVPKFQSPDQEMNIIPLN